MPPRRKTTLIKKKKVYQSKLSNKTNSKNKEKDVPGTSSPKKIVTKSTLKNYDKAGVRRIYSPFNTFSLLRNKNKTPYKPFYQATGLTGKEKSYILSSCQERSRYHDLKRLAQNAINQNKIFSIYGKCNAVRKQLVSRGWVEKITPNKMNLSRVRGETRTKNEIHLELERLMLSNLVGKFCPSFIWFVNSDSIDNTIDMTTDISNVLINRLNVGAMWTSKQGLCSSIKRNYWFYIEDVAEVNAPRTYNTYDTGEIEDFVKDFRITACTSLLKWVLTMEANKRPVFVDSGKISMNALVFALNRCKEYVFRKQNKDIDKSVNNISTGQWSGFLKKYYRIINKDDVFEADKNKKLPLYLSYAECLLKEIYKYRPQLSCEGCLSIWIIKPTHNCRGRGIRMASKLGVISSILNKANSKYVIQKYIEEPLLIHDTKFDIRQYYLVTNTFPLVIWMYRDCYLKFSSQKYNLHNFHESIHLTNNAVQRKYSNCTERHADLPKSNMWDLVTFRNYLDRIGKDKVWENIIYSGMKKSILGITLSCQDSLSSCKNRFELYGCDFILDKQYKPWLIEINSCPDLNNTTQVTGKICPAVLQDIIKVVIDYVQDPNASTGNFECIYRQPMTMPRFNGNIDLSIRGFALPDDYFYKRPIEINESFEDSDVDEEKDIIRSLKMLKRKYDNDIMMEIDSDTDIDSTNTGEESSNCTHCTNSELQVSAEAELITEQLDKLIDFIGFE